MEKNLLVKEAIEKIGQFIDGIGIIFGSYAKGASDKESDLDVFAAGNYKNEEIKKNSRKLNLPLYFFKCAWFDENNYYEFFPLHVVYKNRKHNNYRS